MIEITERVFQILLELLLIPKTYEYLNLWYSMGGPVQDFPMDICILSFPKKVLLEEIF